MYFKPLTIFDAPAFEQLAPGFGAVEAEVELTANASTKTVDAKIVANRFKICLFLCGLCGYTKNSILNV